MNDQHAHRRENEYEPNLVSAPGETLAETLASLAMSQAELAERMGRPKKTISEIVNGKAELTPETAMQLERVLDIPADFWLALERNYRSFLARKAESVRLAAQIDWIRKFPIKDMVSRGWLRQQSTDLDKLRELLRFFGVATPKAGDELYGHMMPTFRKSAALEGSPEAIAAWLRRGELEARTIQCRAFDTTRFVSALAEARSMTQLDPTELMPRLRLLCANAGVAVVFVPGLPKMTASGAAHWINRDKAVIQLSLRHKTDDHIWFTFFHEGAHLVLHRQQNTFVDWPEDGTGARSVEDEANEFARSKLVKPEDYADFVQQHADQLDVKSIVVFARRQGVAPGIVVGMLQHDHIVPFSYFNDLKQRFEWNQ